MKFQFFGSVEVEEWGREWTRNKLHLILFKLTWLGLGRWEHEPHRLSSEWGREKSLMIKFFSTESKWRKSFDMAEIVCWYSRGYEKSKLTNKSISTKLQMQHEERVSQGMEHFLHWPKHPLRHEWTFLLSSYFPYKKRGDEETFSIHPPKATRIVCTTTAFFTLLLDAQTTLTTRMVMASVLCLTFENLFNTFEWKFSEILKCKKGKVAIKKFFRC